MSEIKRDWDVLSDDERRFAVGEIIGYFEKERDEKIGAVAAGQLLDLLLQTTYAPVYNRALDNVKLLLEQSLADVDISLRK
jgi:uncharacterized protein (DUF2164 family)